MRLAVLPLDAGAHVVQQGSFQVLKFPAEMAGDPGVVYLELFVEGRYYEDPEQIAWYDRAMTRLRVQAASQKQSRALLQRAPQGGDHVNKHPLDPPRDIQFRKSSYSTDQQACVEVAVAPDGGRWLRDTKDRTTPAHYYPSTEWDAFVRGVKDGEFD